MNTEEKTQNTASPLIASSPPTPSSQPTPSSFKNQQIKCIYFTLPVASKAVLFLNGLTQDCKIKTFSEFPKPNILKRQLIKQPYQGQHIIIGDKRYIYIELDKLRNKNIKDYKKFNTDKNEGTREDLYQHIQILKSLFYIKLLAGIAVSSVGALSIYQNLDQDDREDIEGSLSIINGSPVSIPVKKTPVKKRINQHDDNYEENDNDEEDDNDGEDDEDDGYDKEDKEQYEEDGEDGEVDYSGSEYE